MTKASRKTAWRRLRRMALKGLGIFIAAIVVALASLPYWMGYALQTLAPKDIVTIGKYETHGYGRFKLSDIEVSSGGINLEIDQMDAPTPLNWIYRAMTSGFDAFVVEVGNVTVEFDDTAQKESDANTSTPKDLFEAMDLLESPLALAHIWVPSARIERATIKASGQSIELRHIVWRDLSLELEAIYADRPESPASITAELGAPTISFTAAIPNEALSWQGQLEIGPDTKATVTNEIAYQENRLTLEADFGAGSWLPQRAEWKADSWHINSDEFGFDILYTDFGFDFSGSWENGAFVASSGGTAEAVGDSDLLPVDFTSSFSGNLNGLSIDRFSLNAPGLTASIKEAVSLDFASKRLQGNILFDIDFDLSLLNIEGLAGILVGTLEMESNAEGKPFGRFELSGTDIAYQDYRIQTLDLNTVLDWPRLEVSQAAATFNEGSNALVSGVFDLDERSSQGVSVEGQFDSAFLSPFLPEAISLESVELKASAEGSLADLSHQGRIAYSDLETTTIKPLSGELQWNGKGAGADKAFLRGDNGGASFRLNGNGSFEETRINVSIDALDIELGGQSIATLQSPSRLQIETGDSTDAFLSDFTLSGSAGEIALNGKMSFPQSGSIVASIANLDTGNWHDPWIKNSATPAEIKSATLDANWDNGPIIGRTALDGWIAVGDDLLFMKGGLNVSQAEIDVGSFQISDRNGALLSLNGKAPYSISSAVDGWLTVNPKSPLSLEIESKNSPTLLTLLSDVLPIELESFELQGVLEGSLREPTGNLTLAVRTLAGEGDHGLPSATVDFAGTLEGPTIELSRVELGLLDETFEAKGTLRFPPSILEYLLLKNPRVSWKETAFALEIPESSVAPIAFWAPTFLRPDGGLSGKIEGSFSSGFDGKLDLHDVNTRPIFPFGSLREISSALLFRENEIELEAFSGKIGREPLHMEGSLNYQNFAEPAFTLKVFGTDLPMVRKPGLLQRGDLDLAISRRGEEPATISGAVNLKKGLFLLDTSALTGGSSGGGRSATSRPPYFAVDVPPVDDWKLDIALQGERFINLQTPAATGELSMDMVLQGTLAEPLLRGRVTYEEGSLLFPFASFGIEQGLIELRIDDPYTPILNITGETRRLGYDLAVEITGSAFDPQIRFSSSPPLTSEQILLMVMAGENPSDSFTYSASQRASKIGSYLSKGLLGSGGSEDGIGSRLSISTGENLSQQGKETMEIEVLLDEQFQLVGEYDEYDAWNAGLRWSILGRNKAKKGEDGE